MNRFILFILLAFSFLVSYSQRTAKVSATYTYYAPETMSVEEAKRVALDRAKIQAIADEFGTIVSQSTSTVITNKNGETDTQFFALGGSDVKGEWIETSGNPEYQLRFENHFLVVTCSVKGKAREINQNQIEILAKPLRNGTTLKYESMDFRNGDDLFLYFISPVDGFLSVYLLDEMAQIVYGILPYKSETVPSTPIEANKGYVFFSVRDAEKNDRKMIDEYKLSCESEKEFNTLYIIFSPNRFGKRNGFDSDFDDIPDNIPYKDFKQWLSKILIKDKTIQVEQISITISK